MPKMKTNKTTIIVKISTLKFSGNGMSLTRFIHSYSHISIILIIHGSVTNSGLYTGEEVKIMIGPL